MKVEVANDRWCADLGPRGASCFRTLSDGTERIPNDEWRELAIGPNHAFGQVCTQAESFGRWKASLLKLCEQTKSCSFQEIQQLEAFGRRVEAVRKRAQAML